MKLSTAVFIAQLVSNLICSFFSKFFRIFFGFQLFFWGGNTKSVYHTRFGRLPTPIRGFTDSGRWCASETAPRWNLWSESHLMVGFIKTSAEVAPNGGSPKSYGGFSWASGFSVVWVMFLNIPLRKLAWQWKIHHLKMDFLLKHGDFPMSC